MKNHIVESLDAFNTILDDFIEFVEKIRGENLNKYQKKILKMMLHNCSDLSFGRSFNKFHEYQLALILFIEFKK